jgi:hypothetical protein
MRQIGVMIAISAASTLGCANAQPSVSMSSLPVPVRDALLALCAPCEFADSNARWNPTDVLNGRPQRRLVTAEETASGWRIEYDHGGRGRHQHIVVFSLEPSVHVAEGSSCLPALRDCEW